MKTLIPLHLLAAVITLAYSNGSRIPPGNAGEPNTGTPCAACHSVTLNPAGGSVSLTLPQGATFLSGTVQRWVVSIADANANYKKGFQLTASAGAFTAASNTVVISSGSKPYVSHTNSAASYAFDWTPPAGVDTVEVYLAGAAASGTRTTNVYTASFTLKRADAKPVISLGGVVNAASFLPGLVSGSWVTIFGQNLAPAGLARAWREQDFDGDRLPVSLEGTAVRINGKNAAIAYVSPNQLNVQAPEDASLGPVSVEVTTAAGGVSDAVTEKLVPAAPGLFRFSPSSYRYVAGVHHDGTLAGPAGLLGDAVTVRPAQPGETLLLFGTGFGPTEPKVMAGKIFSGAAPLAGAHGLLIRIGGLPAEVQFAGLSATGLYQFNVVVPKLPDGDHLVEVSVWGIEVPTKQYLTVRQ